MLSVFSAVYCYNWSHNRQKSKQTRRQPAHTTSAKQLTKRGSRGQHASIMKTHWAVALLCAATRAQQPLVEAGLRALALGDALGADAILRRAEDSAQSRLGRGVAAFRLGEYDRAAALFDSADSAKNAATARNWARAERLVKNPRPLKGVVLATRPRLSQPVLSSTRVEESLLPRRASRRG